MKVAILCLGSQGDVRPFIAVANGLRARGHLAVMFTNDSMQSLCEENGFAFVRLPGDLASIIDAEMNRGGGNVEIIRKIIHVLRETLNEQFELLFACLKEYDAILFHPAVFAAEHLALGLNIPAIQIFLQPEVPTSAHASCLFPPKLPLRKITNRISHVLAGAIFWLPLRAVINPWREKMGLFKAGFFYSSHKAPIQKCIGVSGALIKTPSDWPKNVEIVGYLQLKKAGDWVPPSSLVEFLNAGKQPLYVGFGSLTPLCNKKMLHEMLSVLKEKKIRTILSGPLLIEGPLPDHIHHIQSAPHDWLFPKMCAIVHHGGSGTTHAALCAAKPALIMPFIVDQFHWGHFIHRSGAGVAPISQKKFNAALFSQRLDELLNCPPPLSMAQTMHKENGVARIIELLEKTTHFMMQKDVVSAAYR